MYPPSPVDVDNRKLLPSLSFKNQVSKVIVSIILFFLVYILLLLTATGLAIGCFYLGIKIIIAMPKFITLVAGLGLMAVGFSVILFLIKFIFAVSKNENASRALVTEVEQPELFRFIRKLTDETKTPFPKKIYLSDAVNASVFYNSSFWSMFMPVRKNLEIGLGLVNCINVSEFKAVMAHEFGHFSQRSMKLGSFTYNVNQVIYNMLYENSSYTAFLESWGRLHSLMSFFAGITIKIAQGIQWILRKMYQVINKNYLGLSREMEFHADAVAASVSGGNNLITALGRIEIASNCYHTALDNANELLKQNKVSKNIFSNQLSIFQSLAKDYNLPVKQELPEVSYRFMQTISQSKINYKDQWASHPTLEERKSMIDQLAIYIDPLETRAWWLFADPEKLQEQMTHYLYKAVIPETHTEEYDSTYFEDWYGKKRDNVALPLLYKGFYDGRFINMTNWDLDALSNLSSSKTFDELYTAENGQLQSLININESDLVTLRAIQNRQIDVSSFDFDGSKYAVDDADAVIQQLQKETDLQKELQLSLDKEAFAFFYHKAGKRSGEIKDAYFHFQRLDRQYESYHNVASSIMTTVSPFFSGNVTVEDATSGVTALKENYEQKLKQMLQGFLDEKTITKELNEDLYNSVNHFNGTGYLYFINNEFQSNELNELCDLIVKVADELNNQKFKWYKKMLEEQLKY